MEYPMVRWLMENAWPSRTYGEEVSYFQALHNDSDLWRTVARVVGMLGLADAAMDGFSVEGIEVKTEGRTYTRFSDAFEVCRESYLSPVSYLAYIVENCPAWRIDIDNAARQAGRGLRAFPSFIRELDLEYGLRAAFERRGVQVETAGGSALDVEEHTDILLSVPGVGGARRRYRLWSYIPSQRGMHNLMQKLLGRRGGRPVPRGLHVLCPFSLEDKETVQGWHLHERGYFDRVVDVVLACECSYAAGKGPVDAGAAVRLADVLADSQACTGRVCAFEA